MWNVRDESIPQGSALYTYHCIFEMAREHAKVNFPKDFFMVLGCQNLQRYENPSCAAYIKYMGINLDPA